MNLLFKSIGFATIAAALYFIAPTEKTDALKLTLKRLAGDNAQTCLDLWSGDFKDRESAKIDGSAVTNERIVVDYRSKNSFGAYVKGSVSCPIVKGTVSASAVRNEKLGIRLNTLRESLGIGDEEFETISDNSVSDPQKITHVESNANPDVITLNELILNFGATSWVDIRNEKDEKLAYGSYVRGDELKLKSDTGFSVFIGNADAVTVDLNGKHFEMAKFREGVYAKFNIR